MVILETNCFLRLFPKSLSVATRIFADGYSRKNSLAVCPIKDFGTTMTVLFTSPSRFSSMQAAIISKLFPALFRYRNNAGYSDK